MKLPYKVMTIPKNIVDALQLKKSLKLKITIENFSFITKPYVRGDPNLRPRPCLAVSIPSDIVKYLKEQGKSDYQVVTLEIIPSKRQAARKGIIQKLFTR